jgi:hypothetical protein
MQTRSRGDYMIAGRELVAEGADLRVQVLRARPEIIESTFDRVNIEFTTVFSYHIWWL